MAKEQSLDLQQRVAVLVQQPQRCASRQPLEGFVVDAETQVPCNGDVAHFLPAAVVELQDFAHSSHFVVQSFKCQSFNPLGDCELRHSGDDGGARQFLVAVHELIVAYVKQWRHLEHQLRYALAIGAIDWRVVLVHYMQNDAVVGAVAIVAMAFPVAGTHMHLDVAHPRLSVNLHFGVEEVGASVGV